MSLNDIITTPPSPEITNSDEPPIRHIFPAEPIQDAAAAKLLRALAFFVSSRFVRDMGHLPALYRLPTSPQQLHDIFNKRIRCDPRFGKRCQQTPLIEAMIEAAVKAAITIALKAFHEGLTLNVVADIAGGLGAETITRTPVDVLRTSHPINLVPGEEVFGNAFEDADREVTTATPDWHGFTLSAPGGERNVDAESRFFPGVRRESDSNLPNISVEGAREREAKGRRASAVHINVALWTETGTAEALDEEWDFDSSVEAQYLATNRSTEEFHGLVHCESFTSSSGGTFETSEDRSSVLASFDDVPDTSHTVASGRAAILDRGPEKSEAGSEGWSEGEWPVTDDRIISRVRSLGA